MTTTNFEISKKLAEIGFKPKNEENRVWNYDGQIRWKYPAYDFETLLDALPNFITNHSGTKNSLVVDVAFGEIYYESHGDDRSLFLTKRTSENESLADTAGRLLIKLFEAGIINFKKMENGK